MTDEILSVSLVAVIGACVACGLLQRLRELKADRRRRPGASRGVNRFRSAPRAGDLWSLN